MQESGKSLESEIAKMIVEKAEKALAVEPDLEWWAVLLESFYGLGPSKADRNRIPAIFV